MTNQEREATGFLQNPIGKTIIVFVICLLLFIPTFLLRKLVNERKSYQVQVENEIGEKFGNRQQVFLPQIIIKRGDASTKYLRIMPQESGVFMKAEIQKRKRGIYKIQGYNSEVEIKSNYSNKEILGNTNSEYILLHVPVYDFKRIVSKVQAIVNGKSYDLDLQKNGSGECFFETEIAVKELALQSANVTVQIKYRVQGTNGIGFVPVGKLTRVELQTNWSHPSYLGAYLPDFYTTEKNGISTAKWTIMEHHQNKGISWVEEYELRKGDSFGVDFIENVDGYLSTERSIKYSLLIIICTFITFFFCEILMRINIHPIQYLFIGAALVIFYALLLSLTEVVGFNLGYGIAAFATVFLIGYYAIAVTKNKKSSILICILLSVFYFFVYSLLKLEDFSLLFGSIGLFLILALLMFFSRKIDWYSIGKRNEINTETDESK